MSEPSADAKRELLLRMLRERAAKAPAAPPASPQATAQAPEAVKAPSLQRIPRSDAMELSFGQERIWGHEQVRVDGHNNVLVRFGLRGVLDAEALRRSIEVIVERHEILRATFPAIDGRPVQRISPPSRWEMPTLDLSHLPEPARSEEEHRASAATAHLKFDLAVGPLLQSLLIRLAPEDHVLLITIHHIVSDGWSVDLICKELAALYPGFVAGKPVTLPDLPIQYVDFVHWQRRWMSGAILESRRAYWKKKLAGPLSGFGLRVERPGAGTQSFATAVRNRFTLDPTIVTPLREFSRREGVTLYTTLLAVLKTLLYRYSGQDDVVVGTMVAGRERMEFERLVGFFVNTLVLRSDFAGDPTFREALHRTRDTVLEAQANADFPFDALVNELRPDRNLRRSPFFEVVFNMQGFEFDTGVAAAGLRIASLSSLEHFPVADTLTVFAYDCRSQLDLMVVYSPELFDAQLIERFEGHFTTLLRGIVSNPDQRISALPLLSQKERERIIELGQGPTVAVHTDYDYAHYFEQQVRRTPNALAVADDDTRLSYAELNARANKVAHALIAKGIAAGEPVAMLAERGSKLLTWILGALKAGAAYMPLDARYPAGRHAAMLRQSGARIVLVGAGLDAGIASATQALPAEARPVVLTAGEIDARMEEGVDPPSRTTAQSLAYIIFTSGSTGTPKGATVPHRAMLNHFWTKIRMLGLGPADVVVQSAPIGFDISLWQFLAVLLIGGSVRIAPGAAVQEPERLFDLIRGAGATIAQVVPSFLRAYLDGRVGRVPVVGFERLRSLLLVGEALAPDLARRWLELWPWAPLVNGYGPSECADEATRYVLTRPPGEHDTTVPIGRPIDNVRVHILDRTCGLLPLGVAGELCIGGAGVGLGYLNDPERTAVAFVPDPFGEGEERLYRSGDRARMRADGVVEFLGRLDFQVKIRGHRIELGEIEAVLGQHTGVRQAIVHPWQSTVGERLAAYIVAADTNNAPTAEQLRSHVAATLPSYMTPEDFVFVTELPLNPNGKVNRRALPTPAAAPTRGFTPPATAMEIKVAAIWGTVLSQSRIGADDNFFDLGGQSLLAAQVAARLRNELGVEVGVRAVFEQRTLADLARYMESVQEQSEPDREEVLL